jgi:hypothetical protein
MVVAASKDFSLEEQTPLKDGFKLIRNPKSFRASLVQVSLTIHLARGDYTLCVVGLTFFIKKKAVNELWDPEFPLLVLGITLISCDVGWTDFTP